MKYVVFLVEYLFCLVWGCCLLVSIEITVFALHIVVARDCCKVHGTDNGHSCT